MNDTTDNCIHCHREVAFDNDNEAYATTDGNIFCTSPEAPYAAHEV